MDIGVKTSEMPIKALRNSVNLMPHLPDGFVRRFFTSRASRGERCPLRKVIAIGSDAALNHSWSAKMTTNACNALHPLEDAAPIRLTPRERQVLLWCAYGKSSWEIGQILECKESTVNFHVSNILRKFDVSTRVAAVIKAIRYGMLAGQ